MEKKLLFNSEGDDRPFNRRIINGNTTNLFNLNEVKYPWAQVYYRVMVANFWIPETVDLTQDTKDYAKLTPEETKAFDGIISFLTFLDSIQTNNIPNIKAYVTAPEICSLLTKQEDQEVTHSQSYAYILESVVPVSKRNGVYEMWRTDKTLFTRNKYIADIYQKFVDEPSDENFANVVVANYVLESIYFYNGFVFFYNLASRNTLLGVADEIRYIHRDEKTHVGLFANIINELKRENPGLIKEDVVRRLFQEGVEQEINWTRHIIGNGVLGMDDKSTEKYTKFLANESVTKIGFEKLYPDVNENPYAHLDRFSSSDVKGNFFEAKVTNYSNKAGVDGWHDMFSDEDEKVGGNEKGEG